MLLFRQPALICLYTLVLRRMLSGGDPSLERAWIQLNIDRYLSPFYSATTEFLLTLISVSGCQFERLRSLETFWYEDVDKKSPTLFENGPKHTKLRQESLDIFATGGVHSIKFLDKLIRLPCNSNYCPFTVSLTTRRIWNA